MKRVGLLGGTFDPPHLGHLLMAEEAKIRMDLDEIWWMPNRTPPHKLLSAETTEEQRVQLVSYMVKYDPTYQLCMEEMGRTGPSYTVDTIRKLVSTYEEIQFYFIMGGDSLKHFPTWYHSDQLADMIPFIVINRPGFNIPKEKNPIDTTILDGVALEVSSSDIRKRLKTRSVNRFLLTNEVYQFIKENRLYE